MQVRYEKDNKERIPFEHYLEEFAQSIQRGRSQGGSTLA